MNYRRHLFLIITENEGAGWLNNLAVLVDYLNIRSIMLSAELELTLFLKWTVWRVGNKCNLCGFLFACIFGMQISMGLEKGRSHSLQPFLLQNHFKRIAGKTYKVRWVYIPSSVQKYSTFCVAPKDRYSCAVHVFCNDMIPHFFLPLVIGRKYFFFMLGK